jgi:hypothetical protein
LVWARKEGSKMGSKTDWKKEGSKIDWYLKELIQSQEFYPSGLGMAGRPQPPYS